jgi:hypothetical protein
MTFPGTSSKYGWKLFLEASSALLLKLHKKNRKFWQKFKFHEKPVDFKGRIGYADFRIKQKKGGRLP